MTMTHALGAKVKSILLENAWVRRASDRAVKALLAFVDSAEQVGPRKAVEERVMRKPKRKVAAATGRAAVGTRGAVRTRSTSAREKRIPKSIPKAINSTGGHGLSGEVVERAVKRPAPAFKAKKGKRT